MKKWYLIALAPWVFVYLNKAMEQETQSLKPTTNPYSFDLILLENKCNTSLPIRILDAHKQNLRDFAFGDMPGSIVIEGCLDHYFILKPGRTADIAFFHEGNEQSKINWPIEVRVYGKDDAPLPVSPEQSQFGISITKEETFQSLRKIICFEKKQLDLSQVKSSMTIDCFNMHSPKNYICGFERNENDQRFFGPDEIHLRTGFDQLIFVQNGLHKMRKLGLKFLLIKNVEYNAIEDKLYITNNSQVTTYLDSKICTRS